MWIGVLQYESSVREERYGTSGDSMKKAKQVNSEDEMRPQYDFSGGVRGKYAARFAEGCKVVVLDPDVAEVFPDAVSVNEALRRLMEHSEA